MRRVLALVYCLLVLGLVVPHVFAQDAPPSDGEAKLRKQIDEMTEMLRFSRKVASDLTAQVATMEDGRIRYRKILVVADGVDPGLSRALADIVDSEAAVDSNTEIQKLRETMMLSGSTEQFKSGQELLTNARLRLLQKDEKWTKGMDYLKGVKERLGGTPNGK